MTSFLEYSFRCLSRQLAGTVSPVILDFFYEANEFRANIHNKHSTNTYREEQMGELG